MRPLTTGNATHSLTVFRNAQGVFLPAISSHEHPGYWRILKHSPDNADNNYRSGESLYEGDTIRLCWRFDDQASGFRDFYQDSYGRRRHRQPANVTSNELYLKAPYPRFEPAHLWNHGASLVMSPISSTRPATQLLQVNSPYPGQPFKDYNTNIFDITFRLDSVGNDGDGEIDDYMDSMPKPKPLEQARPGPQQATPVPPQGPDGALRDMAALAGVPFGGGFEPGSAGFTALSILGGPVGMVVAKSLF
jgi:hypothetical protein